MKATMLDFRKQPGRIMKALERNESVTLLYRGKERGILYPFPRGRQGAANLAEHPAFGMWKDRKDLKDPAAYVRRIRAPRYVL